MTRPLITAGGTVQEIPDTVALRVPRGATFPSSPAQGDCFVLTTDGFLYAYNGSAWVARVSGVTKTVDAIVAAAGAQLGLWLRSTQGITAGTPPAVAQWDDGSAYASNASQGTAGSRPSLTSGLVVFDGTDDRLTIADAANLDPTTDFIIAMRVRPDSLAGSKVWISKSDSGAAGEWYVQYSGELRFGCGAGIAGNAPAASFTAGALHTVLCIYRSAGVGNTGRLRWRVNGVEQTNTYYSTIPATLTAGTTVVTLASFSDGAQYAPIAFGEIVFINGALDAQDILDLEDVLTNGPTYGPVGASGRTTVDFGAFPGASDASVTVTGQTTIPATALVQAWLFPADTADHTADEHLVETIQVTAGNVVAGAGFTIYARNTSQLNEPLETTGASGFRSAATSVYGYAAPSEGGMGTTLYGQWSVAWRWWTP